MSKGKVIILSIFSLALLGCGSQLQQHAEAEAPVMSAAKNTEASKLNVQLGLGYLHQGKRELAKTKLIAALQQAPTSSQANDAMGYFLEATGDIEKADQYYKKSLNFAHGKGAPLNNYGTFLCRQGQYAKSEVYFNAAIKDPNYVNAADAYENAGLCSLQIPDPAKAKNYFAMALKQDPRRPTSILELGVISFNQGQYKDAENYLKQYSEIAVANSESTWLAYQVADKLGQKSEAASAAMLLQSKFADSKEYQTYLASQERRTT